MGTATLEAPETVTDTFPINGTDYIEFYVGNAKQAAHYYQTAFGFQLVAYRGPETGVRDRASYVLQQDKIRFVLTTPIRAEASAEAKVIADHVYRHGDGVRDSRFWVEDARDAFAKAVERGAEPMHEPDGVPATTSGEVVIAAIGTYGDTIHSLVEREQLQGPVPARASFRRRRAHEPAGTGLKYVDHCVGNVELGKMNVWVEFYAHVMGFRNLLTFDDEDISTEYSSLMSKVMANGNDRIKFPINEPAGGKKKSQIDEYLEFYERPGVQHMALATDDIIKTVTTLQDPRRRVPHDADDVLRRSAEPRRQDRRARRDARRSSAFSSIAIPTAICCRSSPSRSRIVRRSSTRSSSARARRASARRTSRRCSRRSSASRSCAATPELAR